MTFAVGRITRGQPEFFTGRYDCGAEAMPWPATTPSLDEAHVYDDRVVADLLVLFLDFRDGLIARRPQKNWSVIERPEASS